MSGHPVRLYLLRLSRTTVPLPTGEALEMALGCYLVQTSCGRNILIDSGIAPDARPLSGPTPRGESNVIQQLRLLDIQPSAIDTVVCTHFDADHAGFHDSFPQAEFIVQRSHYELARSGNPRFEKAREHWDHPSLRYTLVEGDTEFLPGLELIETSGHCTGHQSVLVRLPESGPVLLAIDAVMLERLFKADRRAAQVDENAEQLQASTRKLMEIASGRNVSLIVFGHDGLQWDSLRVAPEFYG